MRCKLSTYKVTVETTNALGNTTCNRDTDKYSDCIRGVLYVVTDNPEKIYSTFGKDQVMCIEFIGMGYAI